MGTAVPVPQERRGMGLRHGLDHCDERINHQSDRCDDAPPERQVLAVSRPRPSKEMERRQNNHKTQMVGMGDQRSLERHSPDRPACDIRERHRKQRDVLVVSPERSQIQRDPVQDADSNLFREERGNTPGHCVGCDRKRVSIREQNHFGTDRGSGRGKPRAMVQSPVGRNCESLRLENEPSFLWRPQCCGAPECQRGDGRICDTDHSRLVGRLQHRQSDRHDRLAVCDCETDRRGNDSACGWLVNRNRGQTERSRKQGDRQCPEHDRR